MNKRKTTEQFKREVFDLVKNEYDVLGEYINNKTKILIKHNTCNYEFEMRPHDFLRGQRCPSCGSINKNIKRTKSTKQFKQEVFDLVGDEYEVLGSYKTSQIPILIKHNNCKNKYEVRPDMFLSKGNRCPYCKGNKKKNTDWFKQEVFDLVGDEYEVLENYINNKTKILIKHSTCGNKYKVSPNHFLRERRCPYCKRSRGEEIIALLLDELDYKYETQVSFPDCKYKALLKFDFKIYKKDGSFILLEYNGEQHYKNTFGYQEDFNLQQIRDQVKIDYCKKKGISLHIIRYDEDIRERLNEILERRKKILGKEKESTS